MFCIDLTGKTVLVTGVSSGIGAGIAKMFAKANANVAGCALEEEGSESVCSFKKAIEAECGRLPLYNQADVTKKEELIKFVHAAVEQFGCIDILASNAGANIYRGVTECSYEDWLHNIELNLGSHWNLAQLCKPYLDKSNHGVILINTSCHAYSTMRGSFPYNVAKAGLRALVQSLTIEWGPGIRTVGIAPGFTDTALAKNWFDSFSNPKEERRRTENAFPLKRLGTPDEIGGWFVFLSSEYAAFAGGQTYLIDGGRSAVMMD